MAEAKRTGGSKKGAKAAGAAQPEKTMAIEHDTIKLVDALEARPSDSFFAQFAIAVVIPAYNVQEQITGVLQAAPAFVRYLIVVNDASSDDTAQVIAAAAEKDDRIVLVNHERNRGVGGAMVSGFRKALELEAQIVVKMDGDGQMSPEGIPDLVLPLIFGEADYAKGNRFHDFKALKSMPAVRRFGNLALSFLAKAATGYWNSFDPTNGFLAIRGDVLAQIPLEKIDQSYYFEHSILAQLYLAGAVVQDIPMPALYGEETSNLSILWVLRKFPARLFASFLRRLLLKNFLYDFTMESIYLLFGVPMLLAGILYGGVNWIAYASRAVPAPAGTVVISAMLIILGFQFLLAAINIDLNSVPQQPLCRGPLAGNRR